LSYRKTALTFMLYFTWLCGQAAAQHLPLAQGKEGKSDDVEVKGGISNAVLTAGNRTWFFLSVSNHSPKPISVVRLRELRAEGLKLVSHCWGDPEDTPRGITSGASSDSNTQTPPAILPSDCELIAQELQPGQSAVVSGQLLAEDPHEKQAVIADVSWRRGDNSLSGQFAVLGETAVQSSFEHWRSSATYDLAKDLAWPIVLLMLGAGAGLYDKSREDKRNQVAELRAQTIQTWNSMLPESHKLATNYYMAGGQPFPAEEALA
jgi:hypothetical protein